MNSNYHITDMRGTSLDTLDDRETYDDYVAELVQSYEPAAATKPAKSIEAILFADNGYNSFTD